MNFKLELEFSKAEPLQEVDALKKQIDDMRPLPADVEGRVMQKLRLDWNYHSNAIEGNKLSYGETVAFLMEGITAKGKPLKDHLDIRGHNEAINFLLSIVKDTRPISESDIRSLHKMILVEPYNSKAKTTEGLNTTKRITIREYKTSSNHVETSTGEIHYYATPEETPAKMQELMEWYNEASDNKDIHPVVLAALFHHKFVAIHPFDDGNGRLSRILMNLILMQKGFPPVVIKMDDRQNYYALLSRADNGDSWPFVEYIGEGLFGSLQLFIRAAMGEEIDEEDDIDKKITLFKIEAENNVYLKEKKTTEKINQLIKQDLLHLFKSISDKIATFNDLFFGTNALITFFGKTGVLKSFNIKDLKNAADYVNEESEEFYSIIFLTEHSEFKNSDNTFSLKTELKVEFNTYDYCFFYSNINMIIISKLYNESLTNKDKKKVIDAFAESFMNAFKANINIIEAKQKAQNPNDSGL